MSELVPVDLEEVRRYWFAVEEIVKKVGIEIGKTHTVSKDGKTLVPNVKRFDLIKQMKIKDSTKITVVKGNSRP